MPPPDIEGKQVLLVDGTGRLEEWLGAALEATDLDVQTVGSGGACLSSTESHDVDGIVSTFELPDIDGIRLLRSIRVSYPVLPYVLVPESGSESLAGDAISAGASGYASLDEEPTATVSRITESLDDRRQAAFGGDSEEQRRYRHLIEKSPAAINVLTRRASRSGATRRCLTSSGWSRARSSSAGRSST